ncbi:MAG: SoxR reducing system RseC family protein [Bacteroidetes bacterium]|nr:SoxR reducing system RseC family protein [Bacteroidota bacterium]
MRGEDIYEEGIVLSVDEGQATIAVSINDACEECTARIFCGPGDAKQNTVVARDPFGVHTGDRVRIVVHGEDMFKAAILLYGIPLLLILGGVLFGTYVYDPGIMATELWSFIVGIGAAGMYYLIFLFGGWHTDEHAMMPDIVFVQEKD